MKVGITTLGCKVAQYESQAIAEEFERRGWQAVSDGEGCDAYVINTCTVTGESDRKCRQLIRRAIAKNPSARVAVIGCYAQRAAREVARIEGVDFVLGSEGKLRAVDLLTGEEPADEGTRVLVYDLAGSTFEPMRVEKSPRARAYLKIEDGCDCRCSYCAISAARGPVRSKQPEDVLSELAALAEVAHEVVLTGIELGSYGRDLGGGTDLAALIDEIDRTYSHHTVRLGSLSPELVDDRLIEAIRRSSVIVPHFHLSIQSGSDRILGLMRRRYTRDRVRWVAEGLRSAFRTPVSLTADLMVGFPTESEEDLCDTLRLVSELELADAHVFAFSPREGTVAAGMSGQVEEAVKRDRSRRLIAEVERQRDLTHERCVALGGIYPAILESYLGDGLYTAHTDSYLPLVGRWERGCEGKALYARPKRVGDGVIECEFSDVYW